MNRRTNFWTQKLNWPPSDAALNHAAIRASEGCPHPARTPEDIASSPLLPTDVGDPALELLPLAGPAPLGPRYAAGTTSLPNEDRLHPQNVRLHPLQ